MKMKDFFISLKCASDRREHIINQFEGKGIPFNFFDAIEPSQITSQAEKLGFTTEFGELDWTNIGMGIREIISNALDASYKLLGNANGARILVVEDNQVRAKSEYTRIFIPYNYEVAQYYENINNHFLHFSTKENVYENKIFDKQDQEHGKIYRRGVLAGSLNERSVVNYNVRDID